MKEFILQIGIFMILGKTLLHFCPSSKYEKYLKLLFGFMMVIQFVTPVLSIGTGGNMEEYEKNKVKFENKLEKSLTEVEKKWFVYQEKIENRIERDKEEAEVLLREREEQTERTSQEAAETQMDAKDEEEKKIEIQKVKIEVTTYE